MLSRLWKNFIRKAFSYGTCDKCATRAWLQWVTHSSKSVTVYLGQKDPRVEETRFKGKICEACWRALKGQFKEAEELEAMAREAFSDPFFKEMEKEI